MNKSKFSEDVLFKVDKIQLLCDPFMSCCWPIESPITTTEVDKAMRDKRFCLDLSSGEYTRQNHIERIAYFVHNGWTDAIQIDVGCHACHVAWPVNDGNHRYAAAIYKNDDFILASGSGGIDVLEELSA